MDLIYMGYRKREDLLGSMGAMGEGRRGEKRKVGEQRKVYTSIKAI